MLPLTIVFLLVAVGVLGYKARRRHGFGPLAIGVVAATAIVVSKFYVNEDSWSYAGVFLLVAASLWNAWPRKETTGDKKGHSTGAAE